MSAKYITLNDALYDYVVHYRSGTDDPLLDALRAETEALGDIARMLISREQGDFLTMLTKLLSVRSAVEVGTFTGYSSICIARGLATNGRLTCFDISEEWTAMARRYWEKDGLAEPYRAPPRKRSRGIADMGILPNRWTSCSSMRTSPATTRISRCCCRR